MVFDWLACCVARETDQAVVPIKEPAWPAALHEEDGFFECAETEAELQLLRRLERLQASGASSPGRSAARRGAMPSLRAPTRGGGGEPRHGHHDCGELPEELRAFAARDCTDVSLARAVLKMTHEEWKKRIDELTHGGVELEWATLPQAIRMLKANVNDAQSAVRMFVQALEMRAKERHLFHALRYELRSDARIIGRDLEGHPVVYMCAGSQDGPLSALYQQVIVTFEAACKMAGPLGTVAFIFDMHGLQPHLNMDMKAAKGLADVLGTVFAERICRITIVDFSRAAQCCWWMIKPLMKPATQQKFAFVSKNQACKLFEQHFDDTMHSTVARTMEINRDPTLTAEDRARHARATTDPEAPLPALG